MSNKARGLVGLTTKKVGKAIVFNTVKSGKAKKAKLALSKAEKKRAKEWKKSREAWLFWAEDCEKFNLERLK